MASAGNRINVVIRGDASHLLKTLDRVDQRLKSLPLKRRPFTQIVIFAPRWHGFARMVVYRHYPHGDGSTTARTVESRWIWRGWGRKDWTATDLPPIGST